MERGAAHDITGSEQPTAQETDSRAQDTASNGEPRSAQSPGLEFPRRYHATTGLCVRKDGGNETEDLTLAARNALSNMVDHLMARYGYSDVQAYHLCSVAVNLHASQVVDLPNVLVTAFLPLIDVR